MSNIGNVGLRMTEIQNEQIDKQEQTVIMKNPAVFALQMRAFNSFIDEMIEYMNTKISHQNCALQLNRDILYLKNEESFLHQHGTFASPNEPRLFDFLYNYGQTALRFNHAIDRLMALMGFDYLIRDDFFSDENEFKNHPVIMDFGGVYDSINPICIDRNASYSAYSLGAESKNPVVVTKYSDASEFIKQIIRRALSGYFYKDMHSPAIYQKMLMKPDAGILISLINYFSNNTALVDYFLNIVDFIFELNISDKYSTLNCTLKNGSLHKCKNKPSKLKVGWPAINFIIEELNEKGEYAIKLSETIKGWKRFLEQSPSIHSGRNLSTHRGGIPLAYYHAQLNERGLFISFSTNPAHHALNDKTMSEYHDAIVFCISNYSMILNLYNDFYDILPDAVKNGETIFPKAPMIIQFINT